MHTDMPIACSLDGPQLAARQGELRAGVLGEAQSVERMDNGYRWQFATGEVLSRLATVIDTKRQCCRFLRFSIVVEPGLGAVVLEITGPPGTADFLDSWITPAAR